MGILSVKVYERGEKSVIWVSERAKKGQGNAICATRLFSPIFSFLLEVHALIAATILFASDLRTAPPPKNYSTCQLIWPAMQARQAMGFFSPLIDIFGQTPTLCQFQRPRWRESISLENSIIVRATK